VPSDWLLRNPITGMARCCARTARGHVAATPHESLMKSRRRIVTPPPKEAYRTNRALALKVVRLSLPMSALGQERTYAPQQVMSALPPIATAKADSR
jgi:hypothetical protein